MAFISNTVNSVVDAATGSNSGTNLQLFLSKFGSTEGKYVNTINPLATFDVSMKCYPSVETQLSKTDKVLNTLGTAATSAIKNLGNNLTGGLMSSLMNDMIMGSSAKDYVKDLHDGFEKKGKHTFLEYLAKANMLVGGENWFNLKQGMSPLEIQLGFYVQSATIPGIKIPDGAKSTTLLGEFPINGTYVIPDNNLLKLDVLCTKLPLHERLFYPWMREVTLPYWSYETLPYTTATITIDFSKHTDLKYVFCGCRPLQIETIQPLQEPTAPLTRLVVFLFDFMFIRSGLTVMESTVGKLLSTGKTLFNSASKMG